MRDNSFKFGYLMGEFEKNSPLIGDFGLLFMYKIACNRFLLVKGDLEASLGNTNSL